MCYVGLFGPTMSCLVTFGDTLEGVFVMSIHLKIVVTTPLIFMD